VLDHDDGVGSARNNPACCDLDGGPGRSVEALTRCITGGKRHVRESESDRLELFRPVGVDGVDGESVHVASIEAGHVDRRGDVVGQDPTEGTTQRHLFDP